MVFSAALSLLLVGFVATGVLELITLRAARMRGWLAQPSARSSHDVPTPSVGGIAILIPVIVLLSYLSAVDYGQVLGLTAGLVLLAVIGFWDDLADLGVRLRLFLQILAVAMALTAIGWTAPTAILSEFNSVSGGTLGLRLDSGLGLMAVMLFVGIAVLWHVNLFNFMDGIDGYAGSQCLFFCVAVLALMGPGGGWSSGVLALVSGCCIGFLVYNWPKAKIFMGDVGSAPLGLLIGVLVAQLWVTGRFSLVTLLILLSVFWFDATYTLCVRTFTGQRFAQAHRLHLYQRLTDFYGHRPIASGFWVYALLWLSPLAWGSLHWPELRFIALLLAVSPLAWGCWRYKAGVP